ncbi:MAG: phosphatase, partial [Cytophagaceae bacterium]|nr:phosphatase [Cytophagaceae bacterium]
PLTNAIHQYAPTELIGSAGSFETLIDLSFWRRFGHAAPSDLVSEPLPVDDFYRSRELLLTLPRAERLTLPGMIELRADMIVVGVCLIDFVLKKCGLDQIRVSTYALKEGVLAKILEKKS